MLDDMVKALTLGGSRRFLSVLIKANFSLKASRVSAVGSRSIHTRFLTARISAEITRHVLSWFLKVALNWSNIILQAGRRSGLVLAVMSSSSFEPRVWHSSVALSRLIWCSSKTAACVCISAIRRAGESVWLFGSLNSDILLAFCSKAMLVWWAPVFSLK